MRHDLHSTCNGCIDSEMRSIRDLTLIKLVKNEPNGHTRVIIGCLSADELEDYILEWAPPTYSSRLHRTSLTRGTECLHRCFFLCKLQAREKVTL